MFYTDNGIIQIFNDDGTQIEKYDENCGFINNEMLYYVDDMTVMRRSLVDKSECEMFDVPLGYNVRLFLHADENHIIVLTQKENDGENRIGYGFLYDCQTKKIGSLGSWTRVG